MKGIIGIRLRAPRILGVGEAGLGSKVLLPTKRCYYSRGTSIINKDNGKVKMLQNVQRYDLLDLSFSNYTRLHGITSLFLKFYVTGMCAWTDIDLQG